MSNVKKVTQSIFEDVIERIEEVLDQNGELVKMFYGDYIHHHFRDIMTSSVKYDDVIKTELISFGFFKFNVNFNFNGIITVNYISSTTNFFDRVNSF